MVAASKLQVVGGTTSVVQDMLSAVQDMTMAVPDTMSAVGCKAQLAAGNLLAVEPDKSSVQGCKT